MNAKAEAPLAALPPVDEQHIAAVRRFNRFHTRLVGALGERMLSTDYSLPQGRVLYEVGHAASGTPVTASQLGRELEMDAGYLSRLIASLEAAGLLARQAAAEHGKRLELSLTPAGRQVVAQLDSASAGQVRGLLQRLPAAEQQQLVAAMGQVQRLLGGEPVDGSGDRSEEKAPKSTAAAAGFNLRDPEPGDLGLVVQRQAQLYHQEYGFDWTYEALVAQIVAKFVQEFVPGKERCWIAERDGQVVGSVFVVRLDDETAKLRLLYVDASARGLGLGRRLVDECLAFARAQGYRRMQLWTNAVLVSARRIYEAAGFTLIEQEAHHSFGQDQIGQIWVRDL